MSDAPTISDPDLLAHIVLDLFARVTLADVQKAIGLCEKKLASLRIVERALAGGVNGVAQKEVAVQPTQAETAQAFAKAHVERRESQKAADIPVVAKAQEPAAEPSRLSPAGLRLTKSGKVDQRQFRYMKREALEAEQTALLTPPDEFKRNGAHEAVPSSIHRNGHSRPAPKPAPVEPRPEILAARQAVVDNPPSIENCEAGVSAKGIQLRDRAIEELKLYGRMTATQLGKRLGCVYGTIQSILQKGPFRRGDDGLWEYAG